MFLKQRPIKQAVVEDGDEPVQSWIETCFASLSIYASLDICLSKSILLRRSIRVDN